MMKTMLNWIQILNPMDEIEYNNIAWIVDDQTKK